MSESHSLTDEVVFVFLGDKLPHYAQPSMRLAARTSGLHVRLIGNRPLSRRLDSNVRFTATEDFYDPALFALAAQKILFSHKAGKGFWLKTLERLFVLGQYQDYSSSPAFFHAELDQILFRADQLISNIETLALRGVFVPRHTRERALGSVLYCNSAEIFRSLLEFSTGTDPFQSEMELLARWIEKFPEHAFPLPTIWDAVGPEKERTQLNVGGIVDAAQLGQWAAGIDPRNVPLFRRPANKFVDRPASGLISRTQLQALRFSMNSQGNLVVSGVGDSGHKVFNLHIHSKIHRHIGSDAVSLDRFFAAVNQENATVFPGARAAQVPHRVWKSTRQVLSNPDRVIKRPLLTLKSLILNPRTFLRASRKRLNEFVGRRPPSSPFLSGDTFRRIARHVWEGENARISGPVRAGDVLFCESDKATPRFVEAMRAVKVPIVLLMGNSDTNHGRNLAELRSALHPDTIIFAQNLAQPVDGAHPLPIGLENAWRATNGVVSDFRKLRRRLGPKVFRVMWTFEINTNRKLRQTASKQLTQANIADSLGRLSPSAHREALANYAFVACPPGNGIDTHRAWEALYLRCVPVVLRSHLTTTFADMGLPIWVVDSFDELSSVDEEELERRYIELSGGFETRPLWQSYWTAHILQSRASLIAESKPSPVASIPG